MNVNKLSLKQKYSAGLLTIPLLAFPFVSNLPADQLCCQFKSPRIFCWLNSYTIVGLSLENTQICRLTSYDVSLIHQKYSAG